MPRAAAFVKLSTAVRETFTWRRMLTLTLNSTDSFHTAAQYSVLSLRSAYRDMSSLMIVSGLKSVEGSRIFTAYSVPQVLFTRVSNAKVPF